ncbi:MAG: DUF3352 domain-containing protein [Anaerolineae bacterium]
MKKALAVLLTALMLVVVSPMARALDVTTGPASMARFFDARTSIFVSIRIDDGYLDALSSVVNRIGEKIPPGIVPSGLLPLDLRAQLDSQLALANISLADIRGAVGDHFAVGVNDIEAFIASSQRSGSPEGFFFALAMRDRAALMRLIASNIGQIPMEESFGFTILRPNSDTVIAIGDEVIYIAPSGVTLPLGTRMATLLSTSGFQESAAAMPAESYNIYMYVAYADLLSAAVAISGDMGFSPELMELLPSSLAIGATILDDSVLTIDVVTDQLIEGVLTTPVTPAFGAFIPNGVDLLLWGADLNGYVNYVLDILPDSLSAGTTTTPEEAAAQIEQALTSFTQATGINLREDVLSWMTGDFAIYSTLDLEPLTRFIVAGASGTRAPNLPEFPVEFGVVIATDNPAKTAETVTKLTTLVRAAVANASQLRVNDVNENGFTGIELIVTVPLEGPSRTTSIDILLGSTNEIFFFGTTKTAQGLLAGQNVLNDPVFSRALTYAPPNLVQFAYTDGEGFAGLLGLPIGAALALSGGNPSASEAQAAQDVATMLQVVEFLNRVVDHSIIASGYAANGYVVARATIALR